MENERALTRARYADVGESPLLFQTSLTVLIQRALMREKPLLPAWKENEIEFEAFGGVQRHDRDAGPRIRTFGVRNQRDMLKKRAERREFAQRTSKFLEILQSSFGFRGAFRFPHRDQTAFFEDSLGEIFR